jgi:hypothetical protein
MTPTFPIYRKLSNQKAFYKINSNVNFEELKLMGSKVFHHTIEAVQYPEKLRIMDMIESIEAYLESTEKEWETIYAQTNAL